MTDRLLDRKYENLRTRIQEMYQSRSIAKIVGVSALILGSITGTTALITNVSSQDDIPKRTLITTPVFAKDSEGKTVRCDVFEGQLDSIDTGEQIGSYGSCITTYYRLKHTREDLCLLEDNKIKVFSQIPTYFNINGKVRTIDYLEEKIYPTNSKPGRVYQEKFERDKRLLQEAGL